MRYIVDYEVCAVFFMVLLLIIISGNKKLADFQSKIYRIYTYGIFVNICLDIVTCFTDYYFKRVPLVLNILLNSVFLACQFMIPTLFTVYLYLRVNNTHRLRARSLFPCFIPALAGLFLILTNVWTHWIFYFDATGYHHGSLHGYLYVNALIYSLISLLYSFWALRYIPLRQCCVTWGMITVSLLPTLIQYLLPNYMLSGVGTAAAAYLIFFTDENTVVYVDSLTGALSREAFIYHIKNARKKNKAEKIFIIALDNFKLVNEIYGIEGGNELMTALVQALKKDYPDSCIFRFGGDTFAVIVDALAETIKELDRIRRILGKTWHLQDAEIQMSACICLIHPIYHTKEDLIRAIDYSISQAKSIGKGQFFEMDEQSSGNLSRRTAIEQAIMQSIEANRFEVHYQPIYDVKKRRIHSMEALARLNVPGYGYISPEEFIRVAEQNGTIIQIGMLVLEETCRFIQDYDLKSKGIEFIEVNLSVVQCMKITIYKDIMEILEKYHIPPTMINLEITESAAAYSETLLIRNMARLSLMDVTFSLDDYGSGYSNIQYLVDLPFSIVKIDKYIIWAAMEKVSSRKVVENTINMFKDINLKIVAEGVEDENMVQMLADMGADYLQGYFFSKPVPKEEAIKCLEEGYIEKLFQTE